MSNFQNWVFDGITCFEFPKSLKITFLAIGLRVSLQSTQLKNKWQKNVQIWYSKYTLYGDITWNFLWRSDNIQTHINDLNENNIIYDIFKYVSYRMWYEQYSYLLIGPHKEIKYISGCNWNFLETHFKLFYRFSFIDHNLKNAEV